MNRVFVSYSRRNRTFAERVARDLSDAGLDVWVDFRQIHAGEFWQEEIYRGIERSDMVIPCLSPEFVESEWCQREILTGREQRKKIIPVMAFNAYEDIKATESLRWLLDIHFIDFEGRYEEAFPELLLALPGKRRVSPYDEVDPANIPNPFKGLEAFQQTDAHFFFGRETLVRKSLDRLRQDRPVRFLAVVGASGSGKSSLVRAGVIPKLRAGIIPGSEQWRVLIFTPGDRPVHALAQRLSPLLADRDSDAVNEMLHHWPERFEQIIQDSLHGAAPEAHLLLVIDQFEEVFTRAGEAERELFLHLMHNAVTRPGGRALVLITMRADFFDRLSGYPELAELFEQENMVIVTEMTPPELLRSIEGPAQAVGLVYDEGLPQRILEDVRRQPGSLPLLQYALRELYMRREGNRLTNAAYEAIGGVQRALARHAEDVYASLNAAQQAIMRRLLLRLIEVGDSGDATRRRVDRNDLSFRDMPDEAIQEVIDLLTSARSRLLIISREIKSSDDQTAPAVWVEISHEALIREWDRFKGWVAENRESLRYGSELLQSASDWRQSRRDKAYLLTGNRLVRAEVWLESADPTALQREFIQASVEEHERQEALQREQQERELELQRRATRRLWQFVAVLVVSLVVAIGLSLFAFNSLQTANAESTKAAVALNSAEEARSTAEANANEARSLALSASANRALGDNNGEQAIMLAVAASRIDNPPPQSQRTLAEVAYAPGTRLVFTGHASNIQDVAVSSDGSVALSAAERELLLWDVETGEIIRRFGSEGDSGHAANITSVAFGPGGTRAVSGAEDNTVILWDVASGQILARFEGHSESVTSVDYSPDGARLVSGGRDQLVIIWDIATRSEAYRLEGHTGAINDVAFNPDGTRILSGSDDGIAKLWEAADGAFRRNFITDPAVSAPVTAVAFSPVRASRAVTGQSNGLIQLWNLNAEENEDPGVQTFEEQTTGLTARAVDALTYSIDGGTIFSAFEDGSIIEWDAILAEVRSVFDSHDDAVNAVIAHPNGRFLLSASSDGTVRVWDTERAEQIRTYEGHADVDALQTFNVVGVYGPDDLTVLSGADCAAEQERVRLRECTLRLWNVQTGLSIQEFSGHTEGVLDVAMSADGTRALSGSEDDTLILWDVATGQPIQTMTGHRNDVKAVSFLPGGTRAISGSSDQTLIVWDLATGEMVQLFERAAKDRSDPGHLGPINEVAVSADGRWALSASQDQTLVLWDVESGTQVIKLEGHNRGVRSVAFNPAGNMAASGGTDGTVLLWDLNQESPTFGEIIRPLQGHDRAVLGLDFSPEGNVLVSVSIDGTIRLWDINTGFELRRYITGRESDLLANSVDFSRDGRQVLTGMNDATLREWRVLISLNDLISWTFANRFVPEPTCDERRLFNILPLCADDGAAPTTEPFELPTPTPTLDLPRLTIGEMATVNTDGGDSLRVRVEPNLGAEDVVRLEDGSTVTLLDGPVDADGYTWWRVRTEAGEEGWAAESVPEDGVQTLLPQ